MHECMHACFGLACVLLSHCGTARNKLERRYRNEGSEGGSVRLRAAACGSGRLMIVGAPCATSTSTCRDKLQLRVWVPNAERRVLVRVCVVWVLRADRGGCGCGCGRDARGYSFISAARHSLHSFISGGGRRAEAGAAGVAGVAGVARRTLASHWRPHRWRGEASQARPAACGMRRPAARRRKPWCGAAAVLLPRSASALWSAVERVERVECAARAACGDASASHIKHPAKALAACRGSEEAACLSAPRQAPSPPSQSHACARLIAAVPPCVHACAQACERRAAACMSLTETGAARLAVALSRTLGRFS